MKQVQNSVITGMPTLLDSDCTLIFDQNWPLDKQLPVPKQLSIQPIPIKKSEEKSQNKKGKRCKKKAWNCEHKNKIHYAKGVCQTCYLCLYYHKKAQEEMKQ